MLFFSVEWENKINGKDVVLDNDDLSVRDDDPIIFLAWERVRVLGTLLYIVDLLVHKLVDVLVQGFIRC